MSISPPAAVSADARGRVPGPRDWTLIMCCPSCHSAVSVVAFVRTDDGRLKEGRLECRQCGRSVADVRQFKFDFHLEGSPQPTLGEVRVSHSVAERRIRANSAELSHTSRWHEAPPFYLYTRGGVGDTCSFSGTFTDALIRLRHQPDGGIVDVFVDDVLTASSELFSPEGSFTVPTIAASALPATPHNLVIASRGAAPPGSSGTAALFEELVLYGPPWLDGFQPPQPLNYGNPYSPFIESFLAQASAEELVLEIGGGDRRRVRPNHLNFEYVKFELADVYGDIHALPFQNDTFGIVHSQAVFEHVADPFSAARELLRVTKPGGIVLTEVAFLQPLHAVPYHFFNMTLWGVEELFKDCEIVASDWFGPLSDTVAWLLDAASLTQRVDPERLERIRSEFREFDALMSHDELKPVASGVHIAARKTG
jgi:SAM-dependent methyltransferase